MPTRSSRLPMRALCSSARRHHGIAQLAQQLVVQAAVVARRHHERRCRPATRASRGARRWRRRSGSAAPARPRGAGPPPGARRPAARPPAPSRARTAAPAPPRRPPTARRRTRSWKTLRRLVAERGSNAAISLPGPKRPLSASSVSRIAVGWCAKSSTTVTPRATPRTSCRRRTPRKPRTALRDRRQLDAQAGRDRDHRRPGSRGCRCRAGSSRRRRRARPGAPRPAWSGRPARAATDLERPVGARAGTAVGHDLRARAARDLHRARRGRARHQQPVLRDQRDQLAERGVHRLLVAKDVGVVELDRRQQHDLRAGSAGTSIPCRRTRCRTRRPR